jgi:hypothetical protein
MKYRLITLSVIITVCIMESCRKEDRYVYITGHIIIDSAGSHRDMGNTACNVYRTNAEDNITAAVAGFYTDPTGRFNFKMRRAKNSMVVIAPEASYTNDTFYLAHEQDKYDTDDIILKPIQ